MKRRLKSFFDVKANNIKTGIVPVDKRTLDLFDEVDQRLVGEKMTDLKSKYLTAKAEAKRQREEAKQQFDIIRLYSKFIARKNSRATKNRT